MALFELVTTAKVTDPLVAAFLLSKKPDALLERGNGVWVFDAAQTQEFAAADPEIPLSEVTALLFSLGLVIVPKNELGKTPTPRRKSGLRLTADRKKSLQLLIDQNRSDEDILKMMREIEPSLDAETLMGWVGQCTGQVKGPDPERALRVEVKKELGLPARGRLSAEQQARLEVGMEKKRAR